jgi:hypothetical protein
MFFPIPSFFKMRLIIAVVLLLLGFFFIGLVHRAFAASCSYSLDANHANYYFDSLVELEAVFNANSAGYIDTFGPYIYSQHSWINYGMGAPDGILGYSGNTGTPSQTYDFYFLCPQPCTDVSPVEVCHSDLNFIIDDDGLYCEYHCKCPDYTGQENYDFDTCTALGLPSSCDGVSPSPVDACQSEFNIIWTDQATCQYSGCKCPDYALQDNYDFETCSSSDSCGDQAASECSTLEKVVWENVTTCSFHCDQGVCEDEYQTAKQECEKPHLVDALTCSYTCECEAERNEADNVCPHGYFIDDSTCQYTCKCCEDKATECLEQCGTADNISAYSCTDHSDAGSSCVIDTYTPCECIVPLPDDVDPLENPEPDPDGSGDGHDPDPIDYIDKNQTCFDYRNSCPSSCQFTCETDFDTGKVKYHNCDCHDDPADPGPDGIPGTSDDGDPGSADDGSNGWLKQIESNTSGLADGLGEANGWLKAIKHNTDEVLEDTDNISENVRRGLENDKKYFSDSDGVPYLKKINGKLDGLDKLEGNTVTVVGDSDYSLDAGGYGEAPTDSDLPSDEVLNSSFGTFIPAAEPSFVTDTRSALNSLKPSPVSPVCTVEWNIHKGEFIYDDTWNFCQFEGILSLIGSVLVAMVGFYELYSLTFG